MDLKEKKDLLHTKALNFKDLSMLKKYEEFHEAVIWQYRNDNTLSKLSSNYNVLMLPKNLQDIAYEFLSNKDFIGVLIDKVLYHDNIALSMYRILYKDTNPELTLTSWETLKNDTLLAIYNEKGGSSSALAEMNAELWLTSPIGESYLMEDNLG